MLNNMFIFCWIWNLICFNVKQKNISYNELTLYKNNCQFYWSFFKNICEFEIVYK